MLLCYFLFYFLRTIIIIVTFNINRCLSIGFYFSTEHIWLRWFGICRVGNRRKISRECGLGRSRSWVGVKVKIEGKKMIINLRSLVYFTVKAKTMSLLTDTTMVRIFSGFKVINMLKYILIIITIGSFVFCILLDSM